MKGLRIAAYIVGGLLVLLIMKFVADLGQAGPGASMAGGVLFLFVLGLVAMVSIILIAWYVRQIRDDVRYGNELMRRLYRLLGDRLPETPEKETEIETTESQSRSRD